MRADLLMHLNRVDEAFPICVRAVELDPLSCEARVQHGNALALKGRMEESVRKLRRAIELAPQLVWP